MIACVFISMAFANSAEANRQTFLGNSVEAQNMKENADNLPSYEQAISQNAKEEKWQFIKNIIDTDRSSAAAADIIKLIDTNLGNTKLDVDIVRGGRRYDWIYRNAYAETETERVKAEESIKARIIDRTSAETEIVEHQSWLKHLINTIGQIIDVDVDIVRGGNTYDWIYRKAYAEMLTRKEGYISELQSTTDFNSITVKDINLRLKFIDYLDYFIKLNDQWKNLRICGQYSLSRRDYKNTFSQYLKSWLPKIRTKGEDECPHNRCRWIRKEPSGGSCFLNANTVTKLTKLIRDMDEVINVINGGVRGRRSVREIIREEVKRIEEEKKEIISDRRSVREEQQQQQQRAE